MKMGVWKKCGTDGGLCGEDGTEAGAAWPPLLIWERSSVHAALHVMPGHQPAEHWLAPASTRPGSKTTIKQRG